MTHSGYDLPEVVEARIVIDNRDLPPDELLAALREPQAFTSVFTTQYPRFTHEQAVETLRQLKGRRVLVIDQESTGIKAGSEITEFAAVSLFDENNYAHTLIKPKALIEYDGSKAEGVSGIKASLLQTAKTLPELWSAIKKILDAHEVVISHNADFDFRILRASLQAWDIHAPVMKGTCGMKIATAYFERDYYLSLENACKLAGVDQASFGKAHGALADSKACRAVLLAMIDEVSKL